MSYILDALKKIEQKRAQEESATPLSFYESMHREPQKRSLWPFLLIAVLVLNAGFLFWWIGLKGTDKKEILAKSSAPATAAPDRPPMALHGSDDQLRAIKKSLPPLNRSQDPDRLGKIKVQAPAKPAEEKIPKPKPLKPEASASKPKESPPPEKKVNKGGDKVVDRQDLPEEVKKTLPPFKISAHVYGVDPEGRMVRINDKTLQEGQEVTQGIKVEEIIPGGAVLNYQGYRFRIGLN